MNLKGAQCAHCREIYSLLRKKKKKNISFGHFMILNVFFFFFKCVNILVVSVFWSEPK